MKQRFRAGQCCCTDVCTVLSDSFSGLSLGIKNGVVDANWYALPNLSSHGAEYYAWKVEDADHWLQVDNYYALLVGGVSGFRFYYRGSVPRHFSASVYMRPTFPDSIGSITYAPVTAITDEAKWYRLEVVASGSTYGDADASTACGYLRLRQLLTDTQVLIEVPIPGLCAMGEDTDAVRSMHKARLCYNPDTQILSGSVTTHLGVTHWIHAKGVPAVDEHTSNLSTVTGFGNTNLWFEATNWGTRPTDFGSYIFDNFRLSESKDTPSDYGYYGDYGYSFYTNCPCCKDGCASQTIDLSTTTFDCRWEVVSGIYFDQPGDGTLTVDGKLRWLSSWSGVDDDCLPDYSSRITARVYSDVGGASAVLRINDTGDGAFYDGVLRVETVDGLGNGYLRILDSSGTILQEVTAPTADLSTWMDMTLCFDGDFVTLNALGHQLEVAVEDTGGQFVGIGSSGGYVSFMSVSINHNVYGNGCGNCYTGTEGDGSMVPPGGGTGSDCGTCFVPNLVPGVLKLRIQGPPCAYNFFDQTLPVPPFLQGTWPIYYDAAITPCTGATIDFCGHTKVLERAVAYSTVFDDPIYGSIYTGRTLDLDCCSDTTAPADCDPPYGCPNQATIVAIIYIGWDSDGVCWVYLVIGGFGEPSISCNVASPNAIWRKSLGTCPIDLAEAMEFVALDYVDSCLGDTDVVPPGFGACDTEDQFCLWSQFQMSLRR